MLVVLVYELDDEEDEDILAGSDKHGDDLADLVTEAAIDADERIDVFHLRNTSNAEVHNVLDEIWNKNEKPVPYYSKE
jgi:hypothetical protein